MASIIVTEPGVYNGKFLKAGQSFDDGKGPLKDESPKVEGADKAQKAADAKSKKD